MSTFAHDEPSESLALPPAPESQGGPVKAWPEAVSLSMQRPGPPDKNPMFPPGGVYPLPLMDRVPAQAPSSLWEAIHLENEFLRVMVLPEAEGRIYLGLDKTSGQYFLRQKLESGAAAVPVATYIEEQADGARTVWCSRYDPVSRIKVMHGVCLYPGRAYVEVKVRLFNRTPFVQTFSKIAFGDEQQTGSVHVGAHGLPDLLLLAPYETKAFSEFWYPIQKIGPVQKANVDAAVSLQVQGESAQVGVCVTRAFPKAVIGVEHNGQVLTQWTRDLHPGTPSLEEAALSADARPDELTVRVLTSAGRPLISYTPGEAGKGEIPAQPLATELPAPRRVESIEELYLIGLQLQQEHYGTGRSEDYWREGLRRNAGDLRCNNALGLWYLRRGDFIEAEAHFRRAIATLTARNPNPNDGEPFYNLGLALRYQERDEDAYETFYQASWNFPWRAPALYAIAEIETKRGNYGVVPKYLHEALRLNADNNHARNLAAVLFRRFGRTNEAEHLLRESLALDPLDAWACHLSGRQIPGNNQTRLDLAFDYAHAGLYATAVEVLTAADTFVADGSLPMVHYALASLYTRTGDLPSVQREYLAATQSSPDYCFPSRLEELMVLARAAALQPHDARAQYYLGNLLYNYGRHEEAMELWSSSASLDPSFATVWRNLGISYYNVRNDIPKAFEAFDKALTADGSDARVLYERDQLWKRTGVPPAIRLKELEEYQALAESRDDLAIELAALFNNVHQPVRALALLSSHQFVTSESGPGALEQHVRTHLKLGRQALHSGDPLRASNLFSVALQSPSNLGGTRAALANSLEIWFWLGEAYYLANERPTAQEYWRQAAAGGASFQGVSGKSYSETVFYSGLALARLGERLASRSLFRELWFQGRKLAREKPQQGGDFAVAVPGSYPFKDDPAKRSRAVGLLLQAQGRLGLGQYKLARRLLDQTIALDPNYGSALDLATELPREK